MRIKLLIRAVTTLIFGTLFGLHIFNYRMKWHNLGEDAYLNHEANVFARSIAHPNAVKTFLVILLMATTVAALYELVAAGLTKLTSSARSTRQLHAPTSLK